jgi:hypothetical protein
LTCDSAIDESVAQVSRPIEDQSEEEERPDALGIGDLWDLFE